MAVGPVNNAWIVREQCVNSEICLLEKREKKKRGKCKIENADAVNVLSKQSLSVCLAKITFANLFYYSAYF